MQRNFYHVNLYIDSTRRVSNCSNSNLKGPLGLLRSMLVQITLFFFLYRVRSLHNTDVRSQLFSCRPNSKLSFTSCTTTQVPQTCIFEYVRNVYHQFSRISSGNEIDVIKNCEIVLNLVLLNTGVVFSLELMEP